MLKNWYHWVIIFLYFISTNIRQYAEKLIPLSYGFQKVHDFYHIFQDGGQRHGRIWGRGGYVFELVKCLSFMWNVKTIAPPFFRLLFYLTIYVLIKISPIIQTLVIRFLAFVNSSPLNLRFQYTIRFKYEQNM